jgi:hypothetical protein
VCHPLARQAVLPVLGSHTEAIALAEAILELINAALASLALLCGEHSGCLADASETVATDCESRMSTERVNFQGTVLNEARRLLRDCERLPRPKEVLASSRRQFEGKMYVCLTKKEAVQLAGQLGEQRQRHLQGSLSAGASPRPAQPARPPEGLGLRRGVFPQ